MARSRFFFVSDDLVKLKFDPITHDLWGYRPEEPARMHLRDQGLVDVLLKYPSQVIQSSVIHRVIYLSDPQLYWSSAPRLFNLSEDYMDSLLGLRRLNTPPHFCLKRQKQSDKDR
jgi:hypothetical protein